MYNSKDWYWIIKETGEIYTSKRDAFVTDKDAGYKAFIALGEMPTHISQDDMSLLRIDFLEQSVTERRRREAILTVEGKAWLQGVEDKIDALRF